MKMKERDKGCVCGGGGLRSGRPIVEEKKWRAQSFSFENSQMTGKVHHRIIGTSNRKWMISSTNRLYLVFNCHDNVP